MSKSLKRVISALQDSGHFITPLEMPGETRTAVQAAAAARCSLDQIAKSIIFRNELSGSVILFITAGGNLVDATKASKVAGAPLGKADATLIREQTGFAIGGVSPVGLLQPIPCYWDTKLDDFDVVFAAAGTPRHIFPISPSELRAICGASPADFTIDES
jgi:prolyl-tRNA editing enzyme YbaK/EbsC (Cys-tRNA(Pro) deacylase)